MSAPPPLPAYSWSLDGFALGARTMLPFLPSVVVFAAAFGALAAQKGLTLGEAALMSAIVFAGAAQLVSLELWTDSWTLAAAAAVVFVAFTVNLRMVLMSASVRPWFQSMPAWQAYATLFLNTDANWIAAMRYRAGGGSDAGMFAGSGLILWAVWVVATVPGYLLGALIADPKRYALDLVMPAIFLAMVVPLWKGRAETIGWGVAAIVGLAVQALVPGYWFIVAGALAGALAGAFARGD